MHLPFRQRAASLVFLATLLAPPAGFAQTLGGYGDYLAWEDWARVVPGERAGLASSYDRTGGSTDANHYEFPSGLILGDRDVRAATLTGPGIIYRFWMPHYAASQGYKLQMFFDGESTPRIDSDSDQILGGTYGYFSDPLVTTFAGGQVCYEPIPFRDSVRIETENLANEWHWYHYSYRTFPGGTNLDSYSGVLDSGNLAARNAVSTLFENAGQHPAGESVTAVRTSVAAASVPGGSSLTVADLVGPGLIRRLNLRMDGAADGELDSLNLRISWDGDSEAAIDAPVSWFFGAGHDRAPYKSLPLGTDSPDGFYCYWPMPFRLAARVELVNVSTAAIAVDSVVVEHEPGAVGDDAGYLHTSVRETDANASIPYHEMASATGAGHYVGNLLYIEQLHDMLFFLEGDDLVIVDGTDSLYGTGVEDAYNGGFYYNWVNNPMDEPEGPSPPSAIRPLHGILRVNQTASPELGRADQYRWMIGDRVPFSESLEVLIETKYIWEPSLWRSVTFWYQLHATVTGSPTGPAEGTDLGFALQRIEPNPVRDETLIRFTLPRSELTVLEVLDVRGRRVRTLLDAPRPVGPHELRWRTGSLPNGVYFVRLRAGELSTSRKVVIVR